MSDRADRAASQCMYDEWLSVAVWQGVAGLRRFEDASVLKIWLELGQEVLFDLSDKVSALDWVIGAREMNLTSYIS